MIEFKANTSARLPVRMFDSASGEPKTGILFSSVGVTVELADGSLSAQTVTAENWSEVSGGAFLNTGKYTLVLPAGSFSQPGIFTYAVSCSGARTYVGVVKIVAAEEIDTKTVADAIALKTGNLPADPAREASVTSRASQTSVDAIPTTPLLAGDARLASLSNLDTTVSSRMSASSYTAPDNAFVAAIKAKTDNLPADPASNTVVNSRASQTSVDAIPTNPVLVTDTRLANLDAAVSSRLPQSGYTAPDNVSITAIKAKTDNLPADPASETSVQSRASQTSVDAIPTNTVLSTDARLSNLDATVSSRMSQLSYTAPDNAGVAAIKAKTDALPADPAREASVLSRSTQTSVDAIPTDPLLSTDARLANLDASVSSRMAGSAYTAPDNVSIAAIKAKTDRLPTDPASQSATDEAITASAGKLQGVGAATLAVTVVDDQLRPMPGATVFLKDTSLNICVALGTSDVSGSVLLSHQGGTFQLLTFKTGVVFQTQTLTMTADSATICTVQGSVIVVAPAAAPDMCVIHATLKNLDGTPNVGTAGTITIGTLPQSVNGAFYSGQVISATSDQNGVIAWTLPRETRIVVQVNDFCPRPYGMQVPDSAMVDLANVIRWWGAS